MGDKYDVLKIDNQLCFPLYACAKEIVRKYKPFLDEIDLNEYKIEGTDKEWEDALKKGTKGLVSISSTKKREKKEVKFEDPDEKKIKKAKRMHKKH